MTETAEERLVAERLTAEIVVGTGTVKRFDPVRGDGLVSPDEGDDDLVFHTEAPGGALAPGVRVAFAVDTGARGLEAFDVVPIRPAQQPV
ncbi:MAG TPA: cold shock domain-containing protein [Gaiellaceae bacterium]|nr:cold shock domain-containing protein [Gaiellaceae bacterium]